MTANDRHRLWFSPHLATVTTCPKSEGTRGREPPGKQGGRYGERLEPGLRLGGDGGDRHLYPEGRGESLGLLPPHPHLSGPRDPQAGGRAGGRAGGPEGKDPRSVPVEVSICLPLPPLPPPARTPLLAGH